MTKKYTLNKNKLFTFSFYPHTKFETIKCYDKIEACVYDLHFAKDNKLDIETLELN